MQRVHPVTSIFNQMPNELKYIVYSAYASYIDCFDLEEISRAVLEHVQSSEPSVWFEDLPLVWHSEYIEVLLEELHVIGTEYGETSVAKLQGDGVLNSDHSTVAQSALAYMLSKDAGLASPAIHAKAGIVVNLSHELN